MPIFEYECTECGKRTEHLQLMSDPPLAACPECGGAVEKLMSAPAFQFKGSGWYVTDYAGKGKAPAASDGNGAGKTGSEASESSDAKAAGGSDESGSSKASSTKSTSAKTASPSD